MMPTEMMPLHFTLIQFSARPFRLYYVQLSAAVEWSMALGLKPPSCPSKHLNPTGPTRIEEKHVPLFRSYWLLHGILYCPHLVWTDVFYCQSEQKHNSTARVLILEACPTGHTHHLISTSAFILQQSIPAAGPIFINGRAPRHNEVNL